MHYILRIGMCRKRYTQEKVFTTLATSRCSLIFFLTYFVSLKISTLFATHNLVMERNSRESIHYKSWRQEEPDVFAQEVQNRTLN